MTEIYILSFYIFTSFVHSLVETKINRLFPPEKTDTILETNPYIKGSKEITKTPNLSHGWYLTKYSQLYTIEDTRRVVDNRCGKLLKKNPLFKTDYPYLNKKKYNIQKSTNKGKDQSDEPQEFSNPSINITDRAWLRNLKDKSISINAIVNLNRPFPHQKVKPSSISSLPLLLEQNLLKETFPQVEKNMNNFPIQIADSNGADKYKTQLNNEKTDENFIYPNLEKYSKTILPNPTYPVVLHPKQRTQLYAEVNAPIKKIWFNMGETFGKGDVLVEIRENRFVGQYEKAKAFLEKAESELEVTKDLYSDYIASEYELKEAKAAVAEAKADLIFAVEDLESTIIKAPYAGRVVSVFAQEFELPPANKQLIEIIDDNTLIAKLLVKSENLNELEIGQPLDITLRPSGKKIQAVITGIGAMIDPSSSTIKVEAEVNNENGKLKAGMIGTATISIKNENSVD